MKTTAKSKTDFAKVKYKLIIKKNEIIKYFFFLSLKYNDNDDINVIMFIIAIIDALPIKPITLKPKSNEKGYLPIFATVEIS